MPSSGLAFPSRLQAALDRCSGHSWGLVPCSSIAWQLESQLESQLSSYFQGPGLGLEPDTQWLPDQSTHKSDIPTPEVKPGRPGWKPGICLGVWKSLNSICWWKVGCERYDKVSHSTPVICVSDGGKGFPTSVWTSLFLDNLDCLTLLEPQILTLISISTQTEGSLE